MAEELTDRDRAEFNAWVRSTTGIFFSPGAESSDFYFQIWSAGKAAGIARERERCARICEGNVIVGPLPLDTYAEGQNDCARECAADIRAPQSTTDTSA